MFFFLKFHDNFIIFGGNCEETSLVRKYCQFLCKEICEIENKVFEIEGLHVTFKCAESPNDMKMLAMTTLLFLVEIVRKHHLCVSIVSSCAKKFVR